MHYVVHFIPGRASISSFSWWFPETAGFGWQVRSNLRNTWWPSSSCLDKWTRVALPELPGFQQLQRWWQGRTAATRSFLLLFLEGGDLGVALPAMEHRAWKCQSCPQCEELVGITWATKPWGYRPHAWLSGSLAMLGWLLSALCFSQLWELLKLDSGKISSSYQFWSAIKNILFRIDSCKHFLKTCFQKRTEITFCKCCDSIERELPRLCSFCVPHCERHALVPPSSSIFCIVY